MQTITLDGEKRAVLEGHACAAEPNESCALLLGRRQNGETIIDDIFLTQNADESPVSFSIPDEDLLSGYQEAERKGLQVAGVFHSHPDSDAVPSGTDRRFMYSNPVVWVIYSGVTRQFRAYVYDSDISEVRIIS